MNLNNQLSAMESNKVHTMARKNLKTNDDSAQAIRWYKKRLNALGLFIIALYSFAILSVGIFYGINFSQEKDKGREKLMTTIQTLQYKIGNLEDSMNIVVKNIPRDNIQNSYYDNRSLKSELQTIIDHALIKNSSSNQKKIKLIQLKNQEIEILKQRLRNTKFFKKSWAKAGEVNFQDVSRSPSSLKKGNLNVLRYEQKIKLSHLMEKQKLELKNFSSNLDMSNSEDKLRYQNLMDSQKMEYYKLKDQYAKQRYSLIGDKY